VQHHALEIFKKAFAKFICSFARLRGDLPERFFVRRELKGFKPDGFAVLAALSAVESCGNLSAGRVRNARDIL
jgi:hypothetical protein